jgi:hypothetical protein
VNPVLLLALGIATAAAVVGLAGGKKANSQPVPAPPPPAPPTGPRTLTDSTGLAGMTKEAAAQLYTWLQNDYSMGMGTPLRLGGYGPLVASTVSHQAGPKDPALMGSTNGTWFVDPQSGYYTFVPPEVAAATSSAALPSQFSYVNVKPESIAAFRTSNPTWVLAFSPDTTVTI